MSDTDTGLAIADPRSVFSTGTNSLPSRELLDRSADVRYEEHPADAWKVSSISSIHTDCDTCEGGRDRWTLSFQPSGGPIESIEFNVQCNLLSEAEILRETAARVSPARAASAQRPKPVKRKVVHRSKLGASSRISTTSSADASPRTYAGRTAISAADLSPEARALVLHRARASLIGHTRTLRQTGSRG